MHVTKDSVEKKRKVVLICHGKYRLRLLAESKGYRLDDTGLFPATHSSSGNRVRGTTM